MFCGFKLSLGLGIDGKSIRSERCPCKIPKMSSNQCSFRQSNEYYQQKSAMWNVI